MKKLSEGNFEKALDDGWDLKSEREKVPSKQWDSRQNPEAWNFIVHMELEKFCIVSG